MKFFIPELQNKPKEADTLYKAIIEFSKQTMERNISNRRIFCIKYNHDSKTIKDEVGKISDVNGETVIAILESGSTYLVCTTNHGVFKGMPIMVGTNEVDFFEDFEANT